MKNLCIGVLLVIVSLSSNSAEMQQVLSGNSYDGISKTPQNDYLVATGEQGSVIRFNQDGDSSVVFNDAGYALSVLEGVLGHTYIADSADGSVIKIYASGFVDRFDFDLTTIRQPATILQLPNTNLYVGSLDEGRVTEILNLGPFVDRPLRSNDISNARSVTLDGDNNLYVANSLTAEIFRLNADGDPELFASLPIDNGDMRIGHILYQDNAIYVAGFEDNRLYRISLSGDVTVVAGPGAEGEAANFVFDGPLGLAQGDQPYELYVGNYLGQTLVRVQLDEPVQPQAIVEDAGLSGLWFDPSLDGEGYNIMVSAQGLLLIYYGYDAMGERMWLISDVHTEPLLFNQAIDLTLFQTSGGTFDTPAVPADTTSQWGTAQLMFDNCLSGMITLNGEDGLKVASIQPLLTIENTLCQ